MHTHIHSKWSILVFYCTKFRKFFSAIWRIVDQDYDRMKFFSTDVRHVNVQKTYQQVNKVKKKQENNIIFYNRQNLLKTQHAQLFRFLSFNGRK